jgi:hypothetical protein
VCLGGVWELAGSVLLVEWEAALAVRACGAATAGLCAVSRAGYPAGLVLL